MTQFVAEVTIDLDEKRRVWTTVTASEENGEVDVEKLALAAASGAQQAYDHAMERVAAQTVAEARRRKDPMESFTGSNTKEE